MSRNDGRTGRASAPVHHGEILQGVFAHKGGLHRGLVTLPCALYSVRASFTPGRACLTVFPRWKSKAKRAAELALAELGLPAHGHLGVSDDVPLRRGFGSSTGDVLASIGAVQEAFSSPLPTATVARLAVKAEGASDSVMFTSTTVLFAHRDGEVIEDFGYPLPPLRVLGFGSAPGSTGDGVDTLALPSTRYSSEEVRRFAELRTVLRRAVLTKDVGLLGEVATASARINQHRLPIPRFERLLSIAEEAGAVGVQTAHSGDIAGLLFDRDDLAVDSRTTHAQALLRDAGMIEHWEFSTDD